MAERAGRTVRIVAEIGLNHRGGVEAADRMLEGLLEAGVRAVTFQIREPSFYDGSKPWKRELPLTFYEKAVARAAKAGAEVGFAICDPSLVPALANAGAAFFKSLSWDLVNPTVQEALAASGRFIWASTGVSGLADIISAARRNDSMGFIHTQLSAAIPDQNVRAIETIRAATERPVAFGLHCADHRVAYLALATRPDAMFLYVKEDAEGPYPDDAHALRISDVAKTSADLEILAAAVGSGEKVPLERRL